MISLSSASCSLTSSEDRDPADAAQLNAAAPGGSARPGTGGAPAGLMRVLERGVYRGPHLYGSEPMVRIQVDLGALEAWPSNRIPGFTERLLALLPGLHRHGCCYKEQGGFVRRLHDGTWLGHVAEHLALDCNL
jgi:cyanophycin synthetase